MNKEVLKLFVATFIGIWLQVWGGDNSAAVRCDFEVNGIAQCIPTFIAIGTPYLVSTLPWSEPRCIFLSLLILEVFLSDR